VRKHLPDPFYLEKDQRISLRDKIFREVIANTLVHREYINSFPSRMVIENQKVTIENWNKPYIPGVINPDNFYTHPKNPNILEVFKQIGRADELGSGVRNVFKYGKLYGDADPVFKEGDVFKTIISVPSKQQSDVKNQVIASQNDGINRNDRINNTSNDGLKRNDGLNDTLNKVADTINEIINKGIENRIIHPVKIKVRESMIKIANFLLHNPGINSDQISSFIKRSVPTVERHLIALRKLNIVKHSGSKKTGGYYLTEETENKIKK